MREEKFKEFYIKAMYVSEISSIEIEHFLEVYNNVFLTDYDKEWFLRKYLKNIYGESLILICYHEEKCIATQCFLRNDLDGTKIFQSADSSVLNEFQGRGIFFKLIQLGQEILGENQYIYGFPNNNSIGIFLKRGWNIKEKRKYKFFNRKNLLDVYFIQDEYLDWINLENKYYTKIHSKYYLLIRRKYNIFVIYGEISQRYIQKLRRAKFPIIFTYSQNGKIGNGMILIENFKIEKKIPIYKMDTLIN